MPWGSTYVVDLSVIAGTNIFHGPATMSLGRWTTTGGIPTTCWEETGGDWGWRRFCYELIDRRVSVSGYVTVR